MGRRNRQGAMESDTSNSAGIVVLPAHRHRRQPEISKNRSKSTSRFAECAGSMTAGCAAVCCCFPLGILNLLILAAVRVPVGFCRRVIRRRILLRKEKKDAPEIRFRSGSVKPVWWAADEWDASVDGMKLVIQVGDSYAVKSPAAEVVEMEEEVWSKVYNCGFWRTPSQGEGRWNSDRNGNSDFSAFS